MRKAQLEQVVAKTPPSLPSFENVGDKTWCPFGCGGQLVVTSLTGKDARGLQQGRVEHTVPNCRFWNRYQKLPKAKRDEVMALPTTEAKRDKMESRRR